MNAFTPADRATLDRILATVSTMLGDERRDRAPRRARFLVITHRNLKTGRSVKMPVNLINDMISNIPMEFDNVAGVLVPPPTPGTINLSITDDTGAVSSLGTASMGADGKSVDVTPTPPGDTSGALLNLNFEEMAVGSDLRATLQFSFSSDQAAASVHFVTTGITTRPIGA